MHPDPNTAAAADRAVDAVCHPVFSPFFLEMLQAQRHGDAVSGAEWASIPNLSADQGDALGHLDRGTAGLQAVLALLQAQHVCTRQRPEDFGIGDDHHDGLLHAARELAAGLRTQLDVMGAGRL